MGNLNGFNANNYDPDEYMKHFEPMPSGSYPMAIVNSELKPTKVGNGNYLELELVVASGPYEGRRVWDRLCIEHPKQNVQDIACQQLAAICRIVGIMNPSDSSELHNFPLAVKVKLTKREDNGEPTNEVQCYEALGKKTAPPQQHQKTPTQQTQQPVDNSTPPWSR